MNLTCIDARPCLQVCEKHFGSDYIKVFSYSQARAFFIWICVLRALFDILENILLLVMLNSYPLFNYLLATICCWVTALKFVVLYAWILGIIVRFIKAACSIQRYKS